MTLWHRSTYQNSDDKPVMFYYKNGRPGWTIDRLPTGKSTVADMYEYQVNHNGERVGLAHHLLRNAKRAVDERGAQ